MLRGQAQSLHGAGPGGGGLAHSAALQDARQLPSRQVRGYSLLGNVCPTVCLVLLPSLWCSKNSSFSVLLLCCGLVRDSCQIWIEDDEVSPPLMSIMRAGGDYYIMGVFG